MKCQICRDAMLVPDHMQGIEIDRCPSCRGVWLDCGELERIIDRSDGGSTRAARRQFDMQAQVSHAHYSVFAPSGPTIPRRRRSILGELFNL